MKQIENVSKRSGLDLERQCSAYRTPVTCSTCVQQVLHLERLDAFWWWNRLRTPWRCSEDTKRTPVFWLTMGFAPGDYRADSVELDLCRLCISA